MLILADPFFVNSSREQLRALSERGNVATICPGTTYATVSTMSYRPKLAALYQCLGRYVGKVLALTGPPLLRAQADEVIE